MASDWMIEPNDSRAGSQSIFRFQFYNPSARDAAQKRLALAMLELATGDAIQPYGRTTEIRRREALNWFRGWPPGRISFSWCCEVLGWDPDSFRTQVLRKAREQARLKCTRVDISSSGLSMTMTSSSDTILTINQVEDTDLGEAKKSGEPRPDEIDSSEREVQTDRGQNRIGYLLALCAILMVGTAALTPLRSVIADFFTLVAGNI